ncbi:hypothetical protein, partial [Helcococcus bovis]|uniref:hypothetical protein n=1 Tax=Helcococcus bovis TaxID=3153252 RepID=UPI0038BA87F3
LFNENQKIIDTKIDDGLIMTREEFENYMKNKNVDDKISLRSVPIDGNIYVFDDLYITDNIKKDYFRFLGDYSVSNSTKSNITVTYKQKNTVTVSWNVASSISGTAKIGNKFLGEIQLKAGVEVARNSTTEAGNSLGITATCTPNKKLTLEAYQGGIYANATTVYSKYHKNGSSMGKYTETVSGTVLQTNSYNFKATEENIR